MITNIEFTNRSLELLSSRNLDNGEVSDFSTLLIEAQEKSDQSDISSKEILQGMSIKEIALLQKAHSLAEPINVSSLSEEGAANLLAQPDHSDSVDLNNDGLVEVGLARNIIFPPVNAPGFVKEAWGEATDGMTESDKMMLELRMHISIYGINLDGKNITALPPEQQWNSENIENLFSSLRDNLKFEVNREGWTEFNLMLKDFYDRFETSLNKHDFSSHTADIQAKTGNSQGEKEAAIAEKTVTALTSEATKELMNLVLDTRLGIDRSKLDEIDTKIQAVENDFTLSSEKKQDILEKLNNRKEQFLANAKRRMLENEKSESIESSGTNLLNALNESLQKDKAFI
jgi:hypothetical protein